MRRSIIACAAVALGMFASRTLAQAVNATSNRSASITIHGVTESKSPSGQSNSPFNQTVQDSFNDGTGSPFGINETALSQQTSSINYSNSAQAIDVNVGGTVSFSMLGQDYVATTNACTVTFTLNSPATFSITENSNLEGLGTDGEVWCWGGTLVPGTSPVTLFQPNLIPYIYDLYRQEASTGTPVLPYSGTLNPGTYTYWMFAGGDGTDHEGGSLTFTSDFQVSEVPEPLALPVLCIGALAMLRRRPGRL